LHCIDRETHRPVWAANLVEDFRDPEVDRPGEAKNRKEKLLRAAVPMWGFTQSPVMYEDMLILAPQTQKVGLVAYEKLTGKKRWESGYIGRNWFSHVSPVLMRLGGVDQVIMLAQPSDPEKSPALAPPAVISSIDPKTGKILWQMKTPRPYKIPIPLPLRVGEDEIYITGSYGMGSVWVGVKCSEGKWTAGVVRENRAVGGNMQSPVLYREHIYVQSFKEYGATASGLVCMDLKGGVKWASGPGVQFNSGGMVAADGMIYIMNGKTGELSLVEARPEGFRVLGMTKVLGAEDKVAWGTLALAEGRLLVRDGREMKCLNVSRR
jgi:outer membrane protein assembly factor BamB